MMAYVGEGEAEDEVDQTSSLERDQVAMRSYSLSYQTLSRRRNNSPEQRRRKTHQPARVGTR